MKDDMDAVHPQSGGDTFSLTSKHHRRVSYSSRPRSCASVSLVPSRRISGFARCALSSKDENIAMAIVRVSPPPQRISVMTDNIVASVSRFLTPELIGKLTSAAGLDRNIGQRATAVIVPAILSGLASVAGTPAGSRQLAIAVT